MFGGRAGVLDGSVALYCGVFGYTAIALLRRLVHAKFDWPNPRLAVANALIGYARGWGIGVAILTARQVANAIQGTMFPPLSTPLDALYFLLVTLLFSIPGLIALALGMALRR